MGAFGPRALAITVFELIGILTELLTCSSVSVFQVRIARRPRAIVEGALCLVRLAEPILSRRPEGSSSTLATSEYSCTMVFNYEFGCADPFAPDKWTSLLTLVICRLDAIESSLVRLTAFKDNKISASELRGTIVAPASEDTTFSSSKLRRIRAKHTRQKLWESAHQNAGAVPFSSAKDDPPEDAPPG